MSASDAMRFMVESVDVRHDGGLTDEKKVAEVVDACKALFGKELPSAFDAAKIQETPKDAYSNYCEYDVAYFDIVGSQDVEADGEYGWGSFDGGDDECRSHEGGVHGFECRAGDHVITGSARYDDSTDEQHQVVEDLVRKLRDQYRDQM